ncbi:unnamed protein product, partial [Chrysoparadoxa australica]
NSIVSITDSDGVILFANENFCKISGYSNEELVGQDHRIVNSGYHDKEFFKDMWKTLKSGKKWKGVVLNKAKGGTFYWVDTVIESILNSKDGKTYFVSVRLDVTHLKRYQEILKNIETVAKIGYWEMLFETNDLFWSDEVFEIFGLDKNTYIPTIQNVRDLYSPEHLEALDNALQVATETGAGYDLELQVYHVSGRKIWTRAVSHVEMKHGKPFRIYGTFQDIDRRKRMRLELNKSQAKLNLALESAGIGNWAYFPKFDELVWDDAVFEMFGVDKRKATGKLSDWEKNIFEPDREDTLRSFYKAFEKRDREFQAEFKVIHPEKGERIIKGKAIIEYDEYGNPLEVMGLNWDVTKEVEFQKSLIEAKERALDATQAKSAFLASMSHEIRTPMNGMMGMLELLKESILDSEQEELVDTIENCGQQLLSIVNDILDFSKIEAGKMTMEYRSFELMKVLKGVRSIFESQMSKKGVEFKLDIDERLPKIIKTDETKLKQILTNLISNANKFTHQGSITLSVNYDSKRSGPQQCVLLFKVIDTGIGIPLKKQEQLFESFKQVDDSTSREYGGTGLGLAISKSLVHKLGGNIGVESFPGSGSIFYFELWAGVGEEKAEENFVCLDTDFRKDIRVLLAEDNKTNQVLAVKFLQKLGLESEIIIANNGVEAVNIVTENSDNPFDVILMDIQMPKMDGIQATKEILSLSNETPPVIIAMTANAFEEDKEACFEVGMKGFIPKPIKKALLKEVLSSFFPESSTQQIVPLKKNNEISNQGGTMNSFDLINPTKILFEFEDDFDIFEELVIDYQEQSGDLISQMETSIKNGDSEALRISAHTLKGIVSNFYSEKLRQSAFVLEEAGKNGDFSDTQSFYDEFISLNKMVIEELRAFVDSVKAGTYKAA